MKALNRVTWVILISFGVIGISLTYWSIFGQSLLARDDNPRLVENDLAVRRGTIEDRNGIPLADSTQMGVSLSGKPIYKRRYPYLEAVSATGYYNYDHGSSGVEAAFDAMLRSTDRATVGRTALDSLLHRPLVGSDLRLTVDLKLQTALSSAFKDKRGAAIAIDVPSGAVLGMVSLPGFDPNALDQDQVFARLHNAPSSPLINRVIQQLYAPGAALQTVILAAALSDKLPLSTLFSGVVPSITIGGQSLTCAADMPTLTLQRAYALACPSVFVDTATNRPAKVQDLIAAFGLLRPATLDHLDVATPTSSTALAALTDPVRLRLEAAGQGELRVTPLQMAMVAATIANHGNAITPYVVGATRIPGGEWQARQLSTTPTAIITQEVADSIKAAMLSAVTDGSAQAAQPDSSINSSTLHIYGHAGISYTGSEGNTWFVGFADVGANHSIAIAVVVEGTTDPVIASAIGGQGLRVVSQIQ